MTLKKHCNFAPLLLNCFAHSSHKRVLWRWIARCILKNHALSYTPSNWSHMYSYLVKRDNCRVWPMFTWMSRFWLKRRPWDLHNGWYCLNTVFWLLWRPRRPHNRRIWLNNVFTGCPSFSQIETFVEMYVSLKLLDDSTKLISTISSENCDIFLIKQYW